MLPGLPPGMPPPPPGWMPPPPGSLPPLPPGLPPGLPPMPPGFKMPVPPPASAAPKTVNLWDDIPAAPPAPTPQPPTGAYAYPPTSYLPPQPPATSMPYGGSYHSSLPQSSSYAPRPQHQQSNPASGREATNTVWLGGSGVDRYSDAQYSAIFAPFGKVMRISRLAPQKQTVFIQFRFREEAQNAVREMHARNTLGSDIRVGYGKLFEYTQEELSMPYNPNDPSQHTPAMGMKRDRTDDVYGGRGYQAHGGARTEGAFVPFNQPQPSNVLWVGEIPPNVSTDELRAHFAQFKFRDLSRNENKGIAFIHFDSVEQCQHVMSLMRDVRLQGHLLKLNYGTARKPREEYHAQYGGAPAVTAPKPEDVDPSKEVPSNRLFVGGLPYDVQRAEVDAIFAGFTGFLESRVMADKHFAFIDFDTASNCASCRYALLPSPVVLRGQTLRISFAKDGHNTVPATSESKPFIDFGNDIYGDRNAQLIPPSGATAAAPATLIPPPSLSNASAYLSRSRQAPKIQGVEERAQAFKSVTYNALAVDPAKSLKPELVQELCTGIDNTTTAEGPGCKQLDTVLAQAIQAAPAHTLAVVAKRLFENYNADPNRKMAIMFVVMRAVLKNVTVITQDAAEGVLTILGIVALNQQALDTMRNIRTFLSHYKNNVLIATKFPQDFIDQANKLADDVETILGAQEDYLRLMGTF